MNKVCMKCDARCCRYFSFEIDKPDTYEEFEAIRWYLVHEGASVYIDLDGDWCIRLDNPCRMLVKTRQGWRCKEYANRPLICRQFSPETCDVARGSFACERMFKTARQLDAYARRMLGPEAYRKARAKARPRAEEIGRTGLIE